MVVFMIVGATLPVAVLAVLGTSTDFRWNPSTAIGCRQHYAVFVGAWQLAASGLVLPKGLGGTVPKEWFPRGSAGVENQVSGSVTAPDEQSSRTPTCPAL